jgi:hypothetical protein
MPAGDTIELTTEGLVTAYNTAKMSIPALAVLTGHSYSWTRRRLVDAGVELRGRSRRPCPVPVSQLAAEYEKGASIITLVERYDLYYKRVRELLLSHGVTLRPSTKVGGDARA